jgi:hypothetical protein
MASTVSDLGCLKVSEFEWLKKNGSEAPAGWVVVSGEPQAEVIQKGDLQRRH